METLHITLYIYNLQVFPLTSGFPNFSILEVFFFLPANTRENWPHTKTQYILTLSKAQTNFPPEGHF